MKIISKTSKIWLFYYTKYVYQFEDSIPSIKFVFVLVNMYGV